MWEIVLAILASLVSTEGIKRVIESLVKLLSDKVEKLGYLPKLGIGVGVSILVLAVSKSLGLDPSITAPLFALAVSGAYELVHKVLQLLKKS